MNSREDEGLGRALMTSFIGFDRAFHSSFHRCFAPGQKPTHLFVLGALRRHGHVESGGLRVSDLATALGVTASSVTQIVTELEAKGLVTRTMDPSDRRAVRVALTQEGQGLIGGVAPPFDTPLDDLVASLGEDKARSLIGLLGEVEAFLRRLRPQPAADGRNDHKEHKDQ
jgi:DNA-binding MarR family transcriptional regulator